MARRAVFLDRDGVLNRAVVRDGKPYPPDCLDAVDILPGASAACQQLAAAGFLLVGATNQPDIARRTVSKASVDAINTHIATTLGLDDLRVCPHDDVDDCGCRKPRPGLLVEAARDFDIDLLSSIMVGDRWKDIAAGKAAGCRTVFIDRGYNERRPDGADLIVHELSEAVPWITGETNNE